jgi:hypothetical protein
VAYTLQSKDVRTIPIQETMQDDGAFLEIDGKGTEQEGDTTVPRKKDGILMTPGKPAGQGRRTRQAKVAGADDKKKDSEESRIEKKKRDDELREQRVKNIPNL